MTEKMKNLLVRSISGLVLGVVVLGAIAWSQWSFGALLLALLIVGTNEFYALAEKQGDRPQRLTGIVAGTVLFALNFFFTRCIVAEGGMVVLRDYPLALFGLTFLLLLLPALFICELYRKEENPAGNVGTTLAGIVYVALPLSLMAYIPVVGGVWNPWPMLFFVFIIWANDVFAYLVGMTFGRHRLFERLSPKKSWEGFFGGLAGAFAVGLVASYVFGYAWWVWTLLALIAAVTGVLGDLAESMFKRAAGVKDSGALIPGHGGVLDRFDAMLLAAPFVVVYMLFVL